MIEMWKEKEWDITCACARGMCVFIRIQFVVDFECHLSDAMMHFFLFERHDNTQLTPHALQIPSLLLLLLLFESSFFSLFSQSIFHMVCLHSRRQISYFAILACSTVASMSISISIRTHTSQSIRKERVQKGKFRISSHYNQQMTKIGESNRRRSKKKKDSSLSYFHRHGTHIRFSYVN